MLSAILEWVISFIVIMTTVLLGGMGSAKLMEWAITRDSSEEPKLKLNTRGRLDYYIIAKLERDLFGELFHHEGSPRNDYYCGCEICNPSPKCVNGQLCTRPGTHTIREHLPEWDRRIPKGKMPRTPDRTVYVSKRERYIKIVPKGPSYVSLMRAAMGMEYGYGSPCHHRDGETCWHDGYGE